MVRSAEQATEVIKYICRQGPSLGLNMSASKSVLWNPFASVIPQNFPSDLCTLSQDTGIPILGGSVSISHEFAAKIALKRVLKLADHIEVMLKIGVV